jgi:hypothetical protein
MSALVLFECVRSFEFFVADLTFEVPFVVVSSEMTLKIPVCFEQFAAFWTLKVFGLAVNNRVLFKISVCFE